SAGLHSPKSGASLFSFMAYREERRKRCGCPSRLGCLALWSRLSHFTGDYPNIAWLLLLFMHLFVKRGHRHDADDVVSVGFVTAVDNVSPLLVSQHGSGGAWTIDAILIKGRLVQPHQRELNLYDVIPGRARCDVSRS